MDSLKVRRSSDMDGFVQIPQAHTAEELEVVLGALLLGLLTKLAKEEEP